MKQRKVETNDRFIAFDEYIGRKYGSELKQLLQDDLYDGYDGSASIRVNVNATSEAFTGVPSEKNASARKVKRYVSPSSDTDQSSASPFARRVEPSSFTRMSNSRS